MLRIGSTHITCLYVSVSVNMGGYRLFSFHIWDDLRRHWNILCAHIWDRSPSGKMTTILQAIPTIESCHKGNLDEIERTRPVQPRSREAYPGPS